MVDNKLTIIYISDMKTMDKIQKYIRHKKSVTGAEMVEYLGVSRQAVNKHLKMLIQSGKIRKIGATKGTIYVDSSNKISSDHQHTFNRVYPIAGLEEDAVFIDLDQNTNLKKNVRLNVYDIIHYTFTEILNNAIDHSNSDKCLVNLFIDQYQTRIQIRDYGIGLFYSIYTKFKLMDENEAIGELLKGKTTTMREKHSGEGIFFTSKAAEFASFRSHRLNLIFDNKKKDILVKQEKYINGTEVILQISRNARKKLTTLFNQFAPEEYDYRFEKTIVQVKLFQQDYISRSEARRLLSGLNKFKEIILDFTNVKMIGQGFADEIFRVFKIKYPNITIKVENVLPGLKQMIKHVVDNKFKI